MPAPSPPRFPGARRGATGVAHTRWRRQVGRASCPRVAPATGAGWAAAGPSEAGTAHDVPTWGGEPIQRGAGTPGTRCGARFGSTTRGGWWGGPPAPTAHHPWVRSVFAGGTYTVVHTVGYTPRTGTHSRRRRVSATHWAGGRLCLKLANGDSGVRVILHQPERPNVRTLKGHIEIPLGDVASAGMLGQWTISMAVHRSDVRGVRAGVE